MQNHFGLKDFIFLVLLLGIALSVWLVMIQRDRIWERLLVIDERVGLIEQQISRVEEKLDTGDFRVGIGSGGMGGPGQTDARDESWARPDVEIVWQKPWTFSNDPAADPNFDRRLVGGEFTEIFEAQPATVVPYLSTDVYGRRVIDRVAESMAVYDPKTLELRGVLADAWQVDPDGLWLRVRLNSRARFSDGQPVTAEDVRWTIEDYIRNPQLETERTRSTTDQLDEVRVLGERVVEFTFKEAVYTNVSATLLLYVLPKHFYSQFEANAINNSTGLLMGSGMYRMSTLDRDRQWTPATDLILVRNEQYWGTRPLLRNLRFRTINDDLSRLVAYRAGEGDMILPTSPQFRLVPQQDPTFLEWTKALEWYNIRSGYSFIAWQCGPRNGRLTPFADARVRRAMVHLLDREQMIRDIWEGIGKVSSQPATSEALSFNAEIEPWPYSLEEATRLLAEAGWTRERDDQLLRHADGRVFEFEFTRSQGGEVAERIAAYIRDQCARVGIRCNVRIVDWSVYREILNARDFDSLIMAWSPGSPESDPRQIFHSAAISGQGDNFVQWNNPRADELIEAGRRELDQEKRLAIWHELAELIHEEQPYAFLRESPWVRFIRRDVANVHPYATGLEPWEFFRVPTAAAAPVK